VFCSKWRLSNSNQSGYSLTGLSWNGDRKVITVVIYSLNEWSPSTVGKLSEIAQSVNNKPILVSSVYLNELNL